MKKQFNMNDMSSIAEEWKPSRGINWDKIQRLRFINADSEMPVEDSYTTGDRKISKSNGNNC